MTAQTNITALIDQQAVDFKNIRASILNGTADAAAVAAALTTTAGTMVGAVNELVLAIYTDAQADARVQAAIDNTSTAAGKLWDAARITQEITGAVLGSTDELAEGTTNLYHTSARADARIQNAISDTGTSTSDLWSASKIAEEISTQVTSLIDNAPATLDTLNELAAFATNNESGIANLTTLVSQKANAADVFTKADLGADFPTFDYAGHWTTAIS